MNPVPLPIHDTSTSPGLLPATAQGFVEVGVHADAVVSTAPLMIGALPSGADPPHAARTVIAPAKSAAATVHLPALVRFACRDRASRCV